MEKVEAIVNRVLESSLITFDLEELYPSEEKMGFDLKEHLFMGLILKEKDFREALKVLDVSLYQNKNVAVFCSADAIIPIWAFMLVAVHLQPEANGIYFCTPDKLDEEIYKEKIARIDTTAFMGKRVIIKGCSAKPVPVSAYMDITRRLRPVAKSLMYGEACSNVPLYKQKKEILNPAS